MEKKIQLTVILVFMAFTGMFLASCYPSDSVSYSDLDLVATIYDQDKNFSDLKTYVVPDTIVHLIDTTDPSNNVDITRKFDQQIINLVNENMVNNGYVKELDPENNPPDIILAISAMASKNYNVWYWYPYYWYGYPGWGWYWGYKNSDYWWGWYPGYPGWGGGSTVTSYTTGTLIMHMHDMSGYQNIDPSKDTIPTIWLSTINGLLGSSTNTTSNRLDYSINQAFNQSPYLKIN
jgi:hypothetical protein